MKEREEEITLDIVYLYEMSEMNELMAPYGVHSLFNRVRLPLRCLAYLDAPLRWCASSLCIRDVGWARTCRVPSKITSTISRLKAAVYSPHP